LEALGIPDQVGHHDIYPNGTHYLLGYFCDQYPDHEKCKGLKIELSKNINVIQSAENKTAHKSNLSSQLELKHFKSCIKGVFFLN
jgi:hypothetical protein